MVSNLALPLFIEGVPRRGGGSWFTVNLYISSNFFKVAQ